MDPELEGNMDYELVGNMDIALKSSGSRKRNFCRAAKEHMAWKKRLSGWIFFSCVPWGICGKKQGFHINDDRVPLQ